ncbi:MFS transporter [Cryptosporangium phraense]|uniref:MFS transporter n=1 Tax=Cryptosporangium phraense TaxID=2593070 RepID=UPI0014791156|nr:MFS transporter [Cryptosporangium phraense]
MEGRLLFGTGINGIGGGLWFTIWALYLTRVIGLPAGRLGLSLAVAGVVGIALSLPGGAIADRFGARRVALTINLVRAVACLAFLAVDGLVALTLVAAVFNGAQVVGSGVGNALITGLFDDERRMRMLARSRAAVHAGNTVGAGIGAAVLAVDQRWAYAAAIVFNAVTFVVNAGLLAGVPETPTRRRLSRWAGLRGPAIRDRRYLLAMAPITALTACWAVQSTGIPLWVVSSTSAPPVVAAGTVIVSSVLIAGLQSAVSARVLTIRQGAVAATLAGVVLAVSCLVFLPAAGKGAGWAAVIVLGGGLLHVVGELLFVSGQWAVSVGLMREEFRGEYLGVSAAMTGVVQEFAPGVVVGLVGGLGGVGWVAMAGFFVACAVPILPLAARAASGVGDAAGVAGAGGAGAGDGGGVGAGAVS